MANVRWKDKAAIVVAAGDKIPITDITDSTDKHVTPALLAAFTLDGKTIGDGTAGAIATIDANQTFTNKRLNNPGINSATAITATSAEINKLAGVTATTAEINKLAGLTPTTAELNYVDGVTAPIQTQINSIGSVLTKTFTYGVIFTASGTSKEITEATILTALAVGSNYVIDPSSVMLNVFSVTGGTHSQLDSGAGAQIEFIDITDADGFHIEKLKIGGITNGAQYQITMTCKVIQKAGV